jgi:hypothetical protein
MKRLSAVAIVLLALPALGQIHGVPASVTSQGLGRSATPGIPASVTSLGVRGYSDHSSHSPRFSQSAQFNGGRNFGFNRMCSTPGPLIPSAMGCTSTYFTNQKYGLPLNTPATNLRPRGGNQGAYYPVYVPYTVPVVLDEEPVAQPDTRALTEDEADEPPALTVFEHRAKSSPALLSRAPIDESRVYHPAPTPLTEASAERQAPAIVLIYKDGHQREVQNYAIMGNTLYDIGSFVAQKIPLAELNLKATLKANDERGVEFSLPASVTP